MATAQTVCDAALLRIGVLQRAGETAPAEQSAYALVRLNLAIDQWATNQRYLYAIESERYAIVPNQQTYTLGPSGADWTGTRPVGPPPGNGIKNADYVWVDQSPESRQPIYILNDDEWAALRVPATQTNPVCALYSENTYPNATIHLYGMPTNANEIELFTPRQITQFASLATTFAAPPGYQELMEAELAERLYPSFQQLPSVANVSYELIREQARHAKTEVMRLNQRTFFQPNAYGAIGTTKRYYANQWMLQGWFPGS